MRCTNCGGDNSADATFCEQCGRRLPLICPACKAAVSDKARFCKACGTRVNDARSIRNVAIESRTAESSRVAADVAINHPERKMVTALFADLKDSTELIRALDPESASAIVDPALKIMGEAVRYYGGYVVQSLGDGIFALFGAPLAEEDHAQRAVCAALRMQEQLHHYAQRLITENKSRIEARVGINSGEVVMRSVETGGLVEYVPVGYAAHLAARMQTVARPGGIAISDNTRRLVEGYFELRARGPSPIRGLAEPLDVYEVTGLGPLRTRFEVSARRGLTPFVGRSPELGQMQRAFQLSEAGHGQILAIGAEAGAGKTRLVYEFKRALPARCRMLQANAVAHRQGAAYQPVLDLLHGYFGIEQSDEKRARRDKVERRLTALAPGFSDALAFIFALLGIQHTPDPIAEIGPAVRRRRTLDALKRIMLAESMRHPTVFIFEDLHWIDHETQALLDVLADAIGDSRVLLMVTYRPEYRHEWSNKSYYTELRLDRLSAESADAMLGALLGEASELKDLKHLIDQRTEGNPLFIEETVQALFDEGALVRAHYPEPFSGGDESTSNEEAGGDVTVTRPLSDLQLPSTVQGILAARIDRLDAEHKELLQTLAVIGRDPPRALISELTARPESQLNQMLAVLQAGDFIHQPLDGGGSGYKFKHGRTQEVAYSSLLIERRKLIHQRVADAIESIFAGHLQDHLTELAYHYSCADNVSEAVKYLGLVAKREIVKSAYESALQQLTTARELVSRLAPGNERDRVELDLLIDYGVTLLVLKGFYVPELGEVYRRAANLGKRLGEDHRLLPVLFGLSSFHLCRAELKMARQHIEEMRLLPAGSNEALTILTGWLRGNVQFFMGEFAAARSQFEQAISCYDSSMHRQLAAQSPHDPCVTCLAYDAMALLIMGLPDQAEDRVAAAIALARELDHPFTLAVCLLTAANYICIRRDFNRLPALVAEASELTNEHGFTFYTEAIKGFEIIGLAFEGRMEELWVKSRRATRFSEVRYDLALTWAQSTLAEAFVNRGLHAVADPLLKEAVAKMNRNDERFVESEIERIRGLLRLKQSDREIHSVEEAARIQAEAEQAFRQARIIAQRQGAKLFDLRAAVAIAGLLAGTSRAPEGAETLSQCLSSFTEGFDAPDLVAARAMLERVSTVRAVRPSTAQ